MDTDKMILKKPDSFVGCHILPMQKRMRKRMTDFSLKRLWPLTTLRRQAHKLRRIYWGSQSTNFGELWCVSTLHNIEKCSPLPVISAVSFLSQETSFWSHLLTWDAFLKNVIGCMQFNGTWMLLAGPTHLGNGQTTWIENPHLLKIYFRTSLGFWAWIFVSHYLRSSKIDGL